MAALDAGGDRRGPAPPARGVRRTGHHAVLERADGSLGGFVVRAPWGGGATIAPDLDAAVAILHARRVASGSAGRVRAGLLTENEAGLERPRRGRLARLVAGAAADPRRAARVATDRDLGPVQLRPRLIAGPGQAKWAGPQTGPFAR